MWHENLRCYKQSVELAEGLSKDGAKWPRGYGYLIDQMKRAVASCVLNLAEGNSRKSHIERRRFFEVSRASLAEVSACLDLARAFELMSKEKAISYKSSIEDMSKMIWALMR